MSAIRSLKKSRIPHGVRQKQVSVSSEGNKLSGVAIFSDREACFGTLKELQSTEGLDMFLIFAIMFVNEYRAPAFSWIHFRFVFELTIAYYF